MLFWYFYPAFHMAMQQLSRWATDQVSVFVFQAHFKKCLDPSLAKTFIPGDISEYWNISARPISIVVRVTAVRFLERMAVYRQTANASSE